jgi:hypothetical protein
MLINSKEYISIFNEIKKRIRGARKKMILAANSDLISLYWNI